MLGVQKRGTAATKTPRLEHRSPIRRPFGQRPHARQSLLGHRVSMRKIINIALLGVAWAALAAGAVGVFIPVLPTTPLLLLATFLFARTSPRCHAWIKTTKIYAMYVVAFQDAGGMPASAKMRMLAVSFSIMCISAILVQKPLVWAVLGAVAVFLLYLLLVRIPTISDDAWHANLEMREAE